MNRVLILMILLVGVTHGNGQSPSPVSPAPDAVIATVLDKKITTKDAARLNSIVFGTLLKQYADENKIVPTEAELDTFLTGMDESEKRHLADLEARQTALTQDLQSPSLTEQQRRTKEASLKTIETSLHGLKPFMEQEAKQKEQMRPIKVGVATQAVTKWKINQSLYAKYCGRVIFQQAGPEPMDAYRAFLKEEQAKGNFKILDAKSEDSFWEYFDVANTSLYSKHEGDTAMSTPWWMKSGSMSH